MRSERHPGAIPSETAPRSIAHGAVNRYAPCLWIKRLKASEDNEPVLGPHNFHRGREFGQNRRSPDYRQWAYCALLLGRILIYGLPSVLKGSRPLSIHPLSTCVDDRLV